MWWIDNFLLQREACGRRQRLQQPVSRRRHVEQDSGGNLPLAPVCSLGLGRGLKVVGGK